MPRSPRSVLSGLTLAVVLVASACSSGGGSDADEPAPTSPPSTTAAPEDATTDEGPIEEDADLDLPRAVTYAGVELELTGAMWSNATPGTFGDESPETGEGTQLYLELTTGYVDGYPGIDAILDGADFAVETAGGERFTPTLVDTAEVPVRADDETTVVLPFALPTDDLPGAVLIYDDGEHVPALLPLDGDVPDPGYPVRQELAETVTPELATGCDPAPATVEVTAVEWDLDAGSVDDTLLAPGRTARVGNDHLWARAEVTVTAQAGACGGTYANHDQFRVIADGETIAPTNKDSRTLADGETVDLVYVFEVPDDAAELSLETGKADATTAAVTLELP